MFYFVLWRRGVIDNSIFREFLKQYLNARGDGLYRFCLFNSLYGEAILVALSLFFSFNSLEKWPLYSFASIFFSLGSNTFKTFGMIRFCCKKSQCFLILNFLLSRFPPESYSRDGQAATVQTCLGFSNHNKSIHQINSQTARNRNNQNQNTR